MKSPRGRAERRALEACRDTIRELRRARARDDTTAALRAAVARFPNDAQFAVELGVQLLVDDADEAKACLRRAVRLAPDDPYVLGQAATCLFGVHEYAEAEELTKRGLAITSDGSMHRSPLLSLAGRFAWRRGDEDLAEELLRAAFDAQPDEPVEAEVFAAFLAAQDRIEEALDVAARGLEHKEYEPLRELYEDLASDVDRSAGG